MFRKLVSTPNDFTYTIVRLTLGVVFFAHGAQKMLGWFGGYGFHGTMGFFTQMMHIPAPLAFLAICAEFFGGLGLIVGLLGRVAALGILCNMLVAVFTVHIHYGFFANWSGQQKGEGFEYHLLAGALLLVTIIKGSGAFSFDHALTGSSAAEPTAVPSSARSRAA
ncbi:MAG TPA: DoxX family protein [Candidatus Binatia bacterium]|nr:DoxX family protein [Candidatus Binatia bacterium]